MRFYVKLCEFDRIPWGWGVAWYRPEKHLVIVMPFPFNLLVGLLHEAWFRLIYWKIPQQKLQIWNRGYGVGLKDGLSLSSKDYKKYIEEVKRFLRKERIMKGSIRSLQITSARRNGLTLQEIGDQWGICRERVRISLGPE